MPEPKSPASAFFVSSATSLISVCIVLKRAAPSLLLAAILASTQSPFAHAGEMPGENRGGNRNGSESKKPDPLIAFARRLDVNLDNVYSCEEFTVFMVRVFAKSDRNRNAVLSGNEFTSVTAADPVFSEAEFDYFDANGDRRITQAEFADQPSPLFSLYDKNVDCRVTMDEISGASGSRGRTSKGNEDSMK